MKKKRTGKTLVQAIAWILLGAVVASAAEPLTMDQAVARALADNRLIRAAAATTRAAVAAKKSAKSDFFPELSASYQYTNLAETPYMYFEKAVVVPPGLTIGSQRIEAPTGRRDNFAWNVRLTQPLFTGFALTTRLRMAETGVAEKQVEQAQAELDVIRQVRLACIQVLLAQRSREVADEAVESLSSHVRDAEHYYDQGLIPYNDLLQSRVALASAEQRRTEVRGQVQVAVAALNTLMGYDVDRDTRVAEIAVDPAPPQDLKTLRDIARKERPEPRALALAVDNIDHNITLNRSVYYPQVALVGQYLQEGDNPEASRNDFRNAYNASVTLQAQWRFSTGGKTSADEARLKHLRKALEEKRRGVEESIDLEVKEARVRIEVATENIRSARHALDQARENLRITELRYQQQIATSTDVLDATTARTQARSNYYGALYGYAAARAELDRALGLKTETAAKKEDVHGNA